MSDKVILISGGTKGIGRASVLQMLKEGNRVATFSSNPENVENLKEDVSKVYGERKFFADVCDIKNEEQVQNFVSKVTEKFGRIDVLINNSGIGYYVEADKVDLNKFQEMLQINVFGVTVLTKYVTGVMKELNSGLIINISSISAKKVSPQSEFYAATKFAVQGFSEGLRAELKPFGIKVSTICPGMINTEFFGEEELNRRAEQNGGKRLPMINPEDITSVISLIVNQSEGADIQDITIMPF